MKQCRLTERHQAFWLERICQKAYDHAFARGLLFHFTNLAEEIGIVVLGCVIRQMRPEYFNGVLYAVKFQYFGFFMF